MWWSRTSKSRREVLADLADEQYAKDQIYRQGYWAGRHEAFMYESECQAYYRGGPKPTRKYMQEPRSNYNRLMKHYLKLWKKEKQ